MEEELIGGLATGVLTVTWLEEVTEELMVEIFRCTVGTLWSIAF